MRHTSQLFGHERVAQCVYRSQPCRPPVVQASATQIRVSIRRTIPRPTELHNSATEDAPSTSGRVNPAIWPAPAGRMLLPMLVAAHQALGGLDPTPAHAEAALSGTAVELFRQFLEQIAALGPWGPVLFVLTVMTAEMVPLLPTQPLSIASGLLFGAKQGAALMLLAVSLAAVNAFLLSRGLGRPLAERVIAAEMGKESSADGSGAAAAHGGVAAQIASVRAAIEGGGPLRQMSAVALLRLTPVVPFSASNYVLGLMPLSLPAYLAGTVLGMSVWCVLYASLGGASRALLDGGVDLGVLLEDLAHKASRYSQDVAYVGLAGGALAGAYWLVAPSGEGAGGVDAAAGEDLRPDAHAVDREEALQRK